MKDGLRSSIDAAYTKNEVISLLKSSNLKDFTVRETPSAFDTREEDQVRVGLPEERRIVAHFPTDVPRRVAPHSRICASRLRAFVTAPDELGLDCEPMPFHFFYVAARKQERPTMIV